MFCCLLCVFYCQTTPILKTLGQFENSVFVIMSTRENIRLIARSSLQWGHPSRNGFTSCLPHPCVIENIARHNVGINMSLLDHCLGRTLLELIATIAGPQPPYQPLPILTFTCTRTRKTLGYFCRTKNRFYSYLLSNHLIFE